MKRSIRACILAIALFIPLPFSAAAARNLIPVGTVIGLQLCNDVVTVADFDDSGSSPAKEAGVKVGDEILKINDTPIRRTEDVKQALHDCTGAVNLTIRRGSKVRQLQLQPAMAESGPKLGVYLRQGVAGIGTVTFYDPQTGQFGTLGHGVNDVGGTLLQLKQGFAYEAGIGSVIPGKSGTPGQLKGSIPAPDPLGTLLRNTPQGVFGTALWGWEGQSLPVAAFEEIKTGSALIRSTVNGSTPRDYSVEILKIYPLDRPDCRNFLLKVTDPELLKITGGIVQGMSGSPIIQNGKLVGAVTHVLVNDPTRGYGIFIENMLDAAE